MLLLAMLLLAIPLLLAPGRTELYFAWEISPELTPFTARTLLSWAILFSLFCVTFAFERRWSAFKIPIETISLWIALALLAFVRSWQDADPTNPLLWTILGGIVVALVGLLSLHPWMER